MAASPLISVAKSPQQLFIDLRALASGKMSECLRNNDFVARGLTIHYRHHWTVTPTDWLHFRKMCVLVDLP
jgi:hypothetical protein